MRRTLTSIAAIASIITIINAYYRGSLLAYIETLQISDYTYLIILASTSTYIIIKTLNKYGLMGGVDIFRLTATIAGTLISSSIYALSRLELENSFQLELLSAIIIITSIIFLMYGEFKNPITPLVTWTLLLALIPLPRSTLDQISSTLTGPITWIATQITGGRIIESKGITYIAVKTAEGIEKLFQIASECSGTISILTVASLTPITLYITTTSNTTTKRKIKAFIMAIASAAIISFTGNIMRIILVIQTAKTISYETAIRTFHQTPSIIYIAIATAASLTITLRLPRGESEDNEGENPNLSGSDIIKIASLTLIILIHAGLTNTLTSISSQATPTIIDPAKLIEKPETIIFNKTNVIQKGIPNPIIGEALGALAIHNIMVKEEKYSALGYIEVAETPSRFHGWQVCLTVQGYNIEKWWTEKRNTTITYALISRGPIKLLLAYTTYRYETPIGNIYTKISLFTPVAQEDYIEKVLWLTKILNQPHMQTQTENNIQKINQTLYAGLITSIAISIISITHKTWKQRKIKVKA